MLSKNNDKKEEIEDKLESTQSDLRVEVEKDL